MILIFNIFLLSKLYHKKFHFFIFLKKKAIHLPLVEAGDFLLDFVKNSIFEWFLIKEITVVFVITSTFSYVMNVINLNVSFYKKIYKNFIWQNNILWYNVIKK